MNEEAEKIARVEKLKQQVDELNEVLKEHGHQAGPNHNQCCWCFETIPDHLVNCSYQRVLNP